MYYGIERSTDLRSPQTVVKKFTGIGSLMRWVNERRARRTYSDPEASKNWHHTFRYAYELKGRVDKSDPIFKDRGTPTYPKTAEDRLGDYIKHHGEELEIEEPEIIEGEAVT